MKILSQWSLLLVILMSILMSVNVRAEVSEEGFFSGRISKINKEISSLRIKVDFDNIKYLNPKDKIDFWDEKNSRHKCISYVIARTSDYLLIKIPDIAECQRHLNLSTGSYFKFYSEDLINNLKMGKEVISILLKKRLGVQGQMESRNKEIAAYIDRVNAINGRYESLRDKLDQEWKKELNGLDEDKTYAVRSYKSLERRRDEIDQKLEQYKIKDENLTLDRWSLDSHLYFKK